MCLSSSLFSFLFVLTKAHVAEVAGILLSYPLLTDELKDFQRLRRRLKACAATPESPVPSSSKVAGSGTGVKV